MKAKMTYGGIGPKLALLCLPYIILALTVLLRYPDFWDLGFLDNASIKIFAWIWGGIGLVFWGSSALFFLKDFQQGKLITRGPYALCRNPIYSSIIVFVIPAIAVFFHSGLLLSIALVLYIGFRISIHGETKLLQENFGEEYEEYEKRVNELFPWFRLNK